MLIRYEHARADAARVPGLEPVFAEMRRRTRPPADPYVEELMRELTSDTFGVVYDTWR